MLSNVWYCAEFNTNINDTKLITNTALKLCPKEEFLKYFIIYYEHSLCTIDTLLITVPWSEIFERPKLCLIKYPPLNMLFYMSYKMEELK